MSFQAPNTFDCPWELIRLLPELNGTELKVLLTIISQTLGYTKDEDILSLTQLESRTGQRRQAVLSAIKSLKECDLIVRRKVGNTYAYSLKIEGGMKIIPISMKNTPTVVDSSREDLLFYQTGIGKVYERILGLLPVSQYEVDELIAIEKEFPLTWIEDAFKEAAHARARKPIKYALSCLHNWRDNGKDTNKPNPIPDWVDPAYRGVRKQYS